MGHEAKNIHERGAPSHSVEAAKKQGHRTRFGSNCRHDCDPKITVIRNSSSRPLAREPYAEVRDENCPPRPAHKEETGRAETATRRKEARGGTRRRGPDPSVATSRDGHYRRRSKRPDSEGCRSGNSAHTTTEQQEDDGLLWEAGGRDAGDLCISASSEVRHDGATHVSRGDHAHLEGFSIAAAMARCLAY